VEERDIMVKERVGSSHHPFIGFREFRRTVMFDNPDEKMFILEHFKK
jgi:hypothetical protein